MSRTVSRVDVADRVVPRRGMGRRARAASLALAETLFATEGGAPPRARIEWLLDDLDHFLAHAGGRAKLVYGLCLLAVGWLAPLMVFRPLPLRTLSPTARQRALERFERSPFGLALFGVKALLSILYYEHPEAAALVGHDGTCLLGDPGGTSP